MIDGNQVVSCCCPITSRPSYIISHEMCNNNFNPSDPKYQSNDIISRKEQNNFLLQFFEKDRTIMNNLKTIEDQNKKIESLNQILSTKDNQFIQLDNTIAELKQMIENLNKENALIKDENDKYKMQIDVDTKSNRDKQIVFNSNLNEINNKYLESNAKVKELICTNQQLQNDINNLQKKIYSQKYIKNLEETNQKMKKDINNLQKKIYSLNEIIENNNIKINKLSQENDNIPNLNKNISNLENNIKIIQEQDNILKNNNNDLLAKNQELNNQIAQLMKEMSTQENNFNMQLFNVTSKLNGVDKEWQETTENLEKCKNDKKVLIDEQEKYYNFVNQKLMEINDYLNCALSMDINKLTNELNNQERNSISHNNNDIKYELVENSINNLKKNLLKFILNVRETNNKFMNDFNNLSKDKEISEQQYNQTIQELNKYKQINTDIENKNQEISINCRELTDNYEKLKGLYDKLYNEYSGFTESNSKYINDTQNFYNDLIHIILNVMKDEEFNLQINNSQKSLNKILNECVLKIVDNYKKINDKNIEFIRVEQAIKNDMIKKDEITYAKVMEITCLLEESQKLVKEYEMENKRLKQEIEKLSYRFNLLKASIDTVEMKIQNE